MASSLLGVRKGAWTEEEDNLLRKCIVKYGEGKWNQVPLRAGIASAYTVVLETPPHAKARYIFIKGLKLNTFSFLKSPYLIFLLSVGLNRCRKSCRLRWSLIAGRLPGRTANDVKNHWNTHLQKKLLVAQTQGTDKPRITTGSSILIKPKPRTFSKPTTFLIENTTFEPNIWTNENSSSPKAIDDSIKWWNNLFETKENGEGTTLSNGLSLGLLEDLCLDKNIWEILSSDQTLMQ
ncbi:Transcription factor [Abeliophyllum distichum]|uniref:Transcription factor n=1 Tax=Abeliophyllum distichum TaxID=126358 RepID=A0ABD1V515_9LAMI